MQRPTLAEKKKRNKKNPSYSPSFFSQFAFIANHVAQLWSLADSKKKQLGETLRTNDENSWEAKNGNWNEREMKETGSSCKSLSRGGKKIEDGKWQSITRVI